MPEPQEITAAAFLILSLVAAWEDTAPSTENMPRQGATKQCWRLSVRVREYQAFQRVLAFRMLIMFAIHLLVPRSVYCRSWLSKSRGTQSVYGRGGGSLAAHN